MLILVGQLRKTLLISKAFYINNFDSEILFSSGLYSMRHTVCPILQVISYNLTRWQMEEEKIFQQIHDITEMLNFISNRFTKILLLKPTA